MEIIAKENFAENSLDLKLFNELILYIKILNTALTIIVLNRISKINRGAMKDQIQEDVVKVARTEAHNIHDNQPSIESILIGVHNRNLKNIKDKSVKEYADVSRRQSEVTFLHKLIAAINAATGKNGDVDFESNTDLNEMIEKAKKLGVKIPEGIQGKMTNNQRESFISSIRDTIKDETTLIEMIMQKITNLNYELHESYQWMRSHSKTLFDIMRSIAQKLVNR